MARCAIPLLFGSEDHKAAFDRVIHRLVVMTIPPAIKGRVSADYGTLKRSDTLLDHFIRDRFRAPGFGKIFTVTRVSIQSLLDCGQGAGHFHGICYRAFGLFLQAWGTAIPKLYVEIRGVDYGRRIPGSRLLAHTFRNRLGIGKTKLRAMA